MAIHGPAPAFKGRTFEFWVLNRWVFNFCVRSTHSRSAQWDDRGKKSLCKHAAYQYTAALELLFAFAVFVGTAGAAILVWALSSTADAAGQPEVSKAPGPQFSQTEECLTFDLECPHPHLTPSFLNTSSCRLELLQISYLYYCYHYYCH